MCSRADGLAMWVISYCSSSMIILTCLSFKSPVLSLNCFGIKPRNLSFYDVLNLATKTTFNFCILAVFISFPI